MNTNNCHMPNCVAKASLKLDKHLQPSDHTAYKLIARSMRFWQA
jgi:hypothetical protein